MVNKRIWLGILVLVFGMMVISCNNGTTSDGTTSVINYFDINDYPFNVIDPTEAGYDNTTINLYVFNEIKNLNLPKYLGWIVSQRDSGWVLTFVWTGLSQIEKDSIINFVRSKYYSYSITTSIQLEGDIRRVIHPADLILGIRY